MKTFDSFLMTPPTIYRLVRRMKAVHDNRRRKAMDPATFGVLQCISREENTKYADGAIHHGTMKKAY